MRLVYITEDSNRDTLLGLLKQFPQKMYVYDESNLVRESKERHVINLTLDSSDIYIDSEHKREFILMCLFVTMPTLDTIYIASNLFREDIVKKHVNRKINIINLVGK